MQRVAEAVTALFVPGDRPDRFAKAAAAEPDLVIIDLEDAVAPDAKHAALKAVVAALSEASSPLEAMVRMNAPGSASHATEREALLRLAATGTSGLLGVMLPKAASPDAVSAFTAALAAARTPSLAVIPLIESARGVARSLELASVPGVTRLAFGALDFTLDVAAALDSATVDYARAQLVLASRAAGIAAPLDSPSTEIGDIQAVLASAIAARDMGFGGKLCIHPVQLAPVHRAFSPSAAEIDWAQRVIGAEGGAVQLDGRMVDRPLVERARRILARSGAASQAS